MTALLALASGNTLASQGMFTKSVDGTVYDQLGTEVSGANVTVNVWVGDWPNNFGVMSASRSTVTNAKGYYEVSFDGNEWDDHYVIEVLAAEGLTQWREIAEADAQPYQTIDVDSLNTIPEFGGSHALVLVAVLSAALIGVMRRFMRA